MLLNGSACFGLLMQGLFIFNLSDGIPLASPLLTAFDICLQMFLSMLQLVSASMFWKMRVDTKVRDQGLVKGHFFLFFFCFF
jgi:hypothetical protein